MRRWAHRIPLAAIAFVAAASFGSFPPNVGPDVHRFVFHPTDASIVFAATSAGVFLSTDQGARWRRPSPQLSGQVRSLAMHPGNPEILFAGVGSLNEGGLYRSGDGGKSWRLLAFGGRAVWALAIDPRRPESMFAVATVTTPEHRRENHLFRSADGGASWTIVLRGRKYGVNAVTMASDGTVYAGADGEVLRSADRGDTWLGSGDVLPGRAAEVWELVSDPRQPRSLYALSSWGAIESNDGGKTWAVGNLRCTPIRRFADAAVLFDVCPDVDATFLSAGSRGSLRRSNDAGRTWTPVGSGLPRSWSPKDMAPHPAAPGVAFASWMGGGVYKSMDGGETWNPACKGITWRDLGVPPGEHMDDCTESPR